MTWARKKMTFQTERPVDLRLEWVVMRGGGEKGESGKLPLTTTGPLTGGGGGGHLSIFKKCQCRMSLWLIYAHVTCQI